jgi:hypothetical protein
MPNSTIDRAFAFKRAELGADALIGNIDASGRMAALGRYTIRIVRTRCHVLRGCRSPISWSDRTTGQYDENEQNYHHQNLPPELWHHESEFSQ